MRADHHITRNDDEADRADSARAEWIKERTDALLAEYKADPTRRAKAVGEFMAYAETTDLDLSLRLFLAAYENAKATASIAEAANDLAASIRNYINPILEEWASDAAIEDWNRMEQAEADNAYEQRSAA